MEYCNICGYVDGVYDEESTSLHENSVKHRCNKRLLEYKNEKKAVNKRNKDGIVITGSAEVEAFNNECVTKKNLTDHHKIIICVKPKQRVKFSFTIENESKKDFTFVGIQMAHPQPHFVMNNHPFVFGDKQHILKKKSKIQEEVSVHFEANDIGQYEMPVMFTFENEKKKSYVFIRQMVVMMQEVAESEYIKSPYDSKLWVKAKHLKPSTKEPVIYNFKIPKDLKNILAIGLKDYHLTNKFGEEEKQQLRKLIVDTKTIFDIGITKNNYIMFFRHLLWWEEVIVRINLKKYNMVKVTIQKKNDVYLLEVPGLAEKRPSVLRGDRILIRLHGSTDTIFECVAKRIEDSVVHLSEMNHSFHELYGPEVLFDVRFLLSRVPQERAHAAISAVFKSGHEERLFPVLKQTKVITRPITKFYNKLIASNEEQKSAVEHIVARTSGTAPYIVFGPPGTGKTMTIVEAIIQIVVSNPTSRVLVCTDSNMAADHIALMLLQYNNRLNINNFIFRASSQTREWSVLPPELAPVSNGKNFETFYNVKNVQLGTYKIVVTTLLHSAKFAMPRNQAEYKLQMSHLFIDEAAQASEPVSLVPVTGLLAPRGLLVLAGDPQQLGPVCMSKDAKNIGLDQSLLERLKKSYRNLYDSNPDYITMLVKNFRSDPDILNLPNKLFYENKLIPSAVHDPLSLKSILGLPGGERAVVFHGVPSREQRMKNAPSYFNDMENEMIQRYVKSLINNHDVTPEDIGIVTPYIRQVYKIRAWLSSEKYDKIEIGTVEAFQGKEKRVILVSTVRANCRLLEYDAKYDLGFLVHDKRFNVTVTRAKAKLIIIGNPTCLTRDIKWRMYMNFCKELGTYHGQETEQLERTSSLLVDIAINRFDRCRLTEVIKEARKEQAENDRQKTILHH